MNKVVLGLEVLNVEQWFKRVPRNIHSDLNGDSTVAHSKSTGF